MYSFQYIFACVNLGILFLEIFVKTFYFIFANDFIQSKDQTSIGKHEQFSNGTLYCIFPFFETNHQEWCLMSQNKRIDIFFHFITAVPLVLWHIFFLIRKEISTFKAYLLKHLYNVFSILFLIGMKDVMYHFGTFSRLESIIINLLVIVCFVFITPYNHDVGKKLFVLMIPVYLSVFAMFFVSNDIVNFILKKLMSSFF